MKETDHPVSFGERSFPRAPMSTAHTRKKDPEAVRLALLECTLDLVIGQGLPNVSLQAVADAAGVTKGGLLHHFSSKQILLEAALDHMLDQLDRRMDELMADDPSAHGCFTRAYIELTFDDPRFGITSPAMAQGMAALGDEVLGEKWLAWMKTRLAWHHRTDSAPELEVVRLAVDGVWLAHLGPPGQTCLLHSIPALKERLLAMTR